MGLSGLRVREGSERWGGCRDAKFLAAEVYGMGGFTKVQRFLGCGEIRSVCTYR